MRISIEEFQGFSENWDEEIRQLLMKRMEEGFRRDVLENFSTEEAAVLRAALGRMLPGKDEDGVDLAGFVDWALDKPLGRGDRRKGMPPDDILIRRGVVGIEETAWIMFGKPFHRLREFHQDDVLREIQSGAAKGEIWMEVPPQRFFTKLMLKAVTGYFSYPPTWMRMGFPGPSYPEGYVWIGQKEIMARRRHFPGWKTL